LGLGTAGVHFEFCALFLMQAGGRVIAFRGIQKRYKSPIPEALPPSR
jgi:hypothetical protein